MSMSLFKALLDFWYHLSFAVSPDCDLHMLSASPVEQKEHKEDEEKTHPNRSVSHLQYLSYSLYRPCK